MSAARPPTRWAPDSHTAIHVKFPTGHEGTLVGGEEESRRGIPAGFPVRPRGSWPSVPGALSLPRGLALGFTEAPGLDRAGAETIYPGASATQPLCSGACRTVRGGPGCCVQAHTRVATVSAHRATARPITVPQPVTRAIRSSSSSCSPLFVSVLPHGRVTPRGEALHTSRTTRGLSRSKSGPPSTIAKVYLP